jgi:hypothetical protein
MKTKKQEQKNSALAYQWAKLFKMMASGQIGRF